MSKKTLKIAHLYPELLNLYGDSGNIVCLKKRLEWRGLQADIEEVHIGDDCDFSQADLVFIGGGTDRQQEIVCEELLKAKVEISAYVEDGGVLLAVCGGYQLLGHSYAMGHETLEGLGLVDMHTERGEPRLISDIIVQSDLVSCPIVGYENHGGRTYLSDEVEPLGRVLYGLGNNGEEHFEGCQYKNVIGTYIHGPLLPKNPELSDLLLSTALERKYGEGYLEPLDDSQELHANAVMYNRLLPSQEG